MVNADWHPQHQGFDVNVGGCALGQPSRKGGKAYYSPYANGELPDGPEGEYLTDRLANETINFIKNSSKEPFFTYLSFYSIHWPFIPKPEALTRSNTDRGGMQVCMDDAVGRVLNALDELKLRDNTLVIFTSDNGGTITQPLLRGKKGSIYEGGLRVPLIYRWPEKITAGKTVETPVAAADFFPTLLELLKISVPAEVKRLDGVSYLPLLKGKTDYPAHPVYQHFPHHRSGEYFSGGSTVREGDWKLVWLHYNDSYELYNLQNDVGETRNLADIYPDRVEKLKRKLTQWLTKTDANMPRKK